MKKLTKSLILLTTISIIILSLAACSSKTSITGTYYNQKNKSEYVELKSDKTFFLKEYGIECIGTYSVNGKTITLNTSDGKPSTGTISGNTIVDDENIVWEK
jgi:uncharacterized lipoprotein YehR (DUF1307 family)